MVRSDQRSGFLLYKNVDGVRIASWGSRFSLIEFNCSTCATNLQPGAMYRIRRSLPGGPSCNWSGERQPPFGGDRRVRFIFIGTATSSNSSGMAWSFGLRSICSSHGHDQFTELIPLCNSRYICPVRRYMLFIVLRVAFLEHEAALTRLGADRRLI